MTGCEIIACANTIPREGAHRCNHHYAYADHPDVVTVDEWHDMPKRTHARCGGQFQALERRHLGRLVVQCDTCGMRGHPTFELVPA